MDQEFVLAADKLVRGGQISQNEARLIAEKLKNVRWNETNRLQIILALGLKNRGELSSPNEQRYLSTCETLLKTKHNELTSAIDTLARILLYLQSGVWK